MITDTHEMKEKTFLSSGNNMNIIDTPVVF